MKVKSRKVDMKYLDDRAACTVAAGYSCPKWIEFCKFMLNKSCRVELYEARKTVSKYVTVIRGKKKFKVRFSNHKPIHMRELAGDCDFFVGHTNLHIANTQQAIEATLTFFELPVTHTTPRPHRLPEMFESIEA